MKTGATIFYRLKLGGKLNKTTVGLRDLTQTFFKLAGFTMLQNLYFLQCTNKLLPLRVLIPF